MRPDPEKVVYEHVLDIEEASAKATTAKAEVTEAYGKALADGLNIKVLKQLIRERKLDKVQLDLFNNILANYRQALATIEH